MNTIIILLVVGLLSFGFGVGVSRWAKQKGFEKPKNWIQILLFLIGLPVGAFFANYQINQAGNDPNLVLQNGAWRYFPSMDLAASDIQRAYIGRIGLLALRESEVLYFVAAMDDEGNPLSSKHEYRLSGKHIDARYWSYTLYGEDHFLIDNEADRFSFNMDDVEYRDSTRNEYDIFISKKETKTNWLPTADAENMSILLRLYNPAKEVYTNKETLDLPTITKIK